MGSPACTRAGGTCATSCPRGRNHRCPTWPQPSLPTSTLQWSTTHPVCSLVHLPLQPAPDQRALPRHQRPQRTEHRPQVARSLHAVVEAQHRAQAGPQGGKVGWPGIGGRVVEGGARPKLVRHVHRLWSCFPSRLVNRPLLLLRHRAASLLQALHDGGILCCIGHARGSLLLCVVVPPSLGCRPVWRGRGKKNALLVVGWALSGWGAPQWCCLPCCSHQAGGELLQAGQVVLGCPGGEGAPGHEPPGRITCRDQIGWLVDTSWS